jgi:hypothetical protein
MFVVCYYSTFYILCSSYLIAVVNKRKRYAPDKTCFYFIILVPNNIVNMLQIIRRCVVIRALDILSWGEANFVSTSVLHNCITDYMLMDDFGDKYLENR